MDVVEQTVNTVRQCFPHIDFTLAECPGIFSHLKLLFLYLFERTAPPMLNWLVDNLLSLSGVTSLLLMLL